jgi:NADPH:quinone reductase-like Zn-dependent oxidoreductase
MKQETGDFLYGWPKYPVILGIDLAGKGVTRFKVGDRVLGTANGVENPRNRPTECAFQLYTVLPKNLTSIISDSMSYEQTAAIPLGAGTATCGLYETNQLGLPYPSVKPESTGKRGL